MCRSLQAVLFFFLVFTSSVTYALRIDPNASGLDSAQINEGEPVRFSLRFVREGNESLFNNDFSFDYSIAGGKTAGYELLAGSSNACQMNDNNIGGFCFESDEISDSYVLNFESRDVFTADDRGQTLILTFSYAEEGPGPIDSGESTLVTKNFTIGTVSVNGRGNIQLISSPSSEVREGDTIRYIYERVSGSAGELIGEFEPGVPGSSDINFAELGSDYVVDAVPSWADGEQGRKELVIRILNDAEVENSESLMGGYRVASVEFFNDIFALIEDVNQPPTLQGDSVTASFSLGTVSINLSEYSFDPEGQNLTYTILTQPDVGSVSLNGSTLTFVANNGAVPEVDYQFIVQVEDGAENTADATYRITFEDDRRGTVRFLENTTTLNEGSSADIVLQRVNGSTGIYQVRLITMGGLAVLGEDLTLSPSIDSVIEWGDGDSEDKTIRVQALSDLIPEGETLEFYVLRIVNDSGDGEALDDHEIGIRNVERIVGQVGFTQTEITGSEGDILSIPVRRFDGDQGPIVVTIGDGATEASAAGSDFELITSQLEWQNNDSADKALQVRLLADEVVEDTEFFTLQLSSTDPTHIQPNANAIDIDILDTTTLPPVGAIRFSKSAVELTEGRVGSTVTLTREGGSRGDLTVDLLPIDGSAVMGEDYTLSQSRFVWADGDTTPQSFTITPISDEADEGSEQVVFALALSDDGELREASQLAVSIIDDTDTNEGIPTRAIILEGQSQRGLRATVLAPFSVQVVNSQGDGVPGLQVEWQISPLGAGVLPQSTSETNAQGITQNQLTIEQHTHEIVVTATVQVDPATRSAQNTRLSEVVRPVQAVFRIAAGFGDQGVDDTCGELMNQPDSAVTDAQKDLKSTCLALEENFTQTDLKRLIQDEVSAQGTAIVETANIQVTEINHRLAAIRRGSRQSVDTSGIKLSLHGVSLPRQVSALIGQGISGGNAGDDDMLFSPWGGFVNGSISIGEKSETDRETGFDFKAHSLSFGVDYRFNKETVLGAGLSYRQQASEYQSQGGQLDMDAYSLFVYGTHFIQENWYADGIFRVGQQNFDTKRRINLSSQADQFALSSPKGMDYSISANMGRHYRLGAHTLSPYLRISHTHAEIDGYRERAMVPGAPGFGSVLRVNSQTIKSSKLNFGVGYSAVLSTEHGVYQPSVRLEWEHEFNDDQRKIEGYFAHAPNGVNSALVLTTDKPDRDYLNLGLGIVGTYPNGKNISLSYETQLEKNGLEQHWLKGSFRWELR